MIINKLLNANNMSMYKLSKLSGVAQATISDICSEKTALEKCSVGTLRRIAKVFGVTMDDIMDADEKERTAEYRCSFEVYKSTICHYVKDYGDIPFVIDILEHNRIRELYNKKWYPEAFYMLAMIDYLSRVNDIPICNDYNDIRGRKLKETIYPTGILLEAKITRNDDLKRQALENSIPEFIRYNIVEAEVRNIV